MHRKLKHKLNKRLKETMFTLEKAKLRGEPCNSLSIPKRRYAEDGAKSLTEPQ